MPIFEINIKASLYLKTPFMQILRFLLLLVPFIAWAQPKVPSDYFRSPVGFEISLSGNFGELRGNHFHSGLDIRTNYTQGHPIYATADGYISRINVGHYGYGKALYIQHPNGYTTVYGHLQRFAGTIEKHTRAHQYKIESYEMQMFPEASVLPVKKGDLIAYSGNTGGSGGPHLHYEIRDGNQRPMNPLLFGYKVADNRKPTIQKLRIYALSPEAHLDHQDHDKDLRLTPQDDGSYLAETVNALGKVGLGVAAFDRLNSVENKNGIYSIETKVNGETHQEIQFDRFSFAETRFINQYIDYGYWKDNKLKIQKLFREKNNPLSLIAPSTTDGYLDVKEGMSYMFEIILKDFVGNATSVKVPIIGKERITEKLGNLEKEGELYIASKVNAVTKGNYHIYLPENTLYKNTHLDFYASNDTLYLHEDREPLHKNITVSYNLNASGIKDADKYFIGRLPDWGKPRHYKTEYKNNKLSIKTRDFGTYTLIKDTTPPSISPLNFSEKKWISSNETLRIKIEDDLSGIASYRATINGKFILMEYEYKDNSLTYHFSDQIIKDTENNLKLIVIDNVGNSATFEATFYRKEL